MVVLTGAGLSAESGVPTFRGPEGLWGGHVVQDVATPHAFDVQPEVVQIAAAYGARTLELNLVPSDGSQWFDEARQGRAAVLGREWTDELLAEGHV